MSAQGPADPAIVGFTEIEAVVRGAHGQERLSLLVDSGARFTVLPHDIWRAIGLAPERTMTFQLADGTHIERAMSECHIELGENRGHTPVVLGAPNDVALLGVITLEQFGLILNPFSRTLQPARMLLARAA